MNKEQKIAAYLEEPIKVGEYIYFIWTNQLIKK